MLEVEKQQLAELLRSDQGLALCQKYPLMVGRFSKESLKQLCIGFGLAEGGETLETCKTPKEAIQERLVFTPRKQPR